MLRKDSVTLQECPKVHSKRMGVPRLLDIVRTHYWTTSGPESEKPAAGEGRLSEVELIEIRRGLLNITKILMQHSIMNGTWRSERSWGDIQARNFQFPHRLHLLYSDEEAEKKRKGHEDILLQSSQGTRDQVNDVLLTHWSLKPGNSSFRDLQAFVPAVHGRPECVFVL